MYYSHHKNILVCKVDYNKHLPNFIGGYVQALVINFPSKTILPNTLAFIYLLTVDILQGVHEVMDLATGCIVACTKVTARIW